MLRISKLADYATVIMRFLSLQPAAAYTAADIAAATGVPLPTARKILKQLAQFKLLQATRGKEGGYQLAKLAPSIFLGEIIEAIDGPLALTECCIPKNDCEQQSSCHTKDHWQIINKVVRDALYTVNLAHMDSKPYEVRVALPKSQKRG